MIYPTTTPVMMGTSFISPLQKVSTRMAVMREEKARIQLAFAISTALPERERPMRMMAGPMTTGGKMRSSSFLPCHFTRALITKYTSETLVSPAMVPGNPHCLLAAMIGAMKAKELPRKIGTLPPVMKWNRKVPTPAVKRAVAGSMPMRSGTKTVAPKATKRNCTPTMVFLVIDNCSVSIKLLLNRRQKYYFKSKRPKITS